MKEIVVVTNARHVSRYTLALTFSDGSTAEVDYAAWIEQYPYFEPLKDIDYCRNFSLDGWTVVWPNGADIAAEKLHKAETDIRQSQKA